MGFTKFLLFGFQFVREGPLEKLWEGGIFELNEFFFVNISLAGLFLPYAKSFFLGYSLCMKFFHSIFPFMNFFWTSPAPVTFLTAVPYSVCNGAAQWWEFNIS